MAICPVVLKISTENFTQELLDGLIFSVESTGPFSASFEPDSSSIPSIDDLSNGVIELRGTLVFEAEEEQEIIIVEEEPMSASIQVEVGDLRASGDTGPI